MRPRLRRLQEPPLLLAEPVAQPQQHQQPLAVPLGIAASAPLLPPRSGRGAVAHTRSRLAAVATIPRVVAQPSHLPTAGVLLHPWRPAVSRQSWAQPNQHLGPVAVVPTAVEGTCVHVRVLMCVCVSTLQFATGYDHRDIRHGARAACALTIRTNADAVWHSKRQGKVDNTRETCAHSQ